jgi:ATP-dependent DNA helicase Q1
MTSYEQKQALNDRLTQLEAEINSIDMDIKNLKTARTILVREREHIISEINPSVSTRHGLAAQKDDLNPGNVIDYSGEFVEWHSILKARMKNVFGISSFRLCQQG